MALRAAGSTRPLLRLADAAVPAAAVVARPRASRRTAQAMARAPRLLRRGRRRSRARLWVHAVSLGETRAAAPLIDALRAAAPGVRLLLTHGTATGRAGRRARCCATATLQAWLPYDTPGAVRRFLRATGPRSGVLMETEIWPNLLHEARAAGVPMVLANARLSRAQPRARASAWPRCCVPAAAALRRACWRRPTADARRLRAGRRAAGARSCGNLKFDVTPAPELLARGRAVARARWPRRWCWPASRARARRQRCCEAWARLRAPRPLLLLGAAPSAALRRGGATWSPRAGLRAGAAQRLGARRRRPTRLRGRRLARRLDGRDAAVLRAAPTWRCSAAASRRWAGRT
ncbi:MAG: hypothetical protein MZW92_56950 [Comamonadaceae bacterium]|nr:hypothetical protein [Comamonadaceae bacterium]